MPAALLEDGEHDVLDRDVLVLQALRLALRAVQQVAQPAGDVDLAGRRAGTGHARTALEVLVERGDQGPGVDVRALEQAAHQPFGLLEQREQQVLDVDLGVAVAKGLRLCVVQGFLRLLGQLVGVHLSPSHDAVGGFVGAQAGLEHLDAIEQIAGQHRAGVVEAEVATQPDRPDQAAGGVAGEGPGGRDRAAGRVEQPQGREAAHDLGVQAGLARERVQPDPPGLRSRTAEHDGAGRLRCARPGGRAHRCRRGL